MMNEERTVRIIVLIIRKLMSKENLGTNLKIDKKTIGYQTQLS